jgi:FHA domain-containing protein
MSILRDFEKRLEGAVEGFFARAFRSGLQPVELAKALQRYAANYQQVGLDGVIIPNVYRFALSAEDTERFSGFAESLRRELAQVVTRTAADRDWRLQGPVRIEFVESEEIRTGTYELRGKVEAGPRSEPRAAPQPQPRPYAGAEEAGRGAGTRVLAPARAELVGGDGRRHAVSMRGTTTVGRLPDCDVTLDDAAVSRRHARLTTDGATFHVEDLNSTNGVRLNGQPVTRAALQDGDQLDFGGVRFTFSLVR